LGELSAVVSKRVTLKMTNKTSTPVSKALLKNAPKDVTVPTYDREKLTDGILHIGVGGFHRSHQALYLDDLFQSHGLTDWAICGVGIMPQDAAMSEALNAQDCLYTLVERAGKKSNARIIGALRSYIFGYEHPEVVFAKMADPSIKIVSLTATEGGYCFNQGTGELDFNNKGIQNDLQNPGHPQTIFGYLAEGLERRRKAGVTPFTVLSCDNLQGNGHVAKSTLLAFCNKRNPDLAKWIDENVSFPNCMVDRITPATTDAEREFVRETYNLEDAFPVVAEPFKQWVIEDNFCNGRPPLEKVGVQFTSDVAPYEKMKIRLLNASHSAMGYLGYLCGYRYIYEIAQAAEFIPYIKGLMDEEVTPLVGEIPGVNLAEYKQSLMERFTNETIKDQALRICLDGSSKLPKFILPSISEQLELNGPIRKLTLCVASWMRFLSGKDEEGQEIPIQDPQAERLTSVTKKTRDPKALLELTDIFGDLGKSERFVKELDLLVNMLYDKGAKETLKFVMTEK
jgi:mannitol 2-dehydrogenase